MSLQGSREQKKAACNKADRLSRDFIQPVEIVQGGDEAVGFE